MEARVGIEPTNKGFADLCLTTWLPRLVSAGVDQKRPRKIRADSFLGERGFGAGDGTRTRDIDLGKVALYQLSYSRASSSIVPLRSASVKAMSGG